MSGFQIGEIYLQPDYSNRVTGVNDTLSGITIERNKIGVLHFREAGDYSTKLHKNLTIKNNIFSGSGTTAIDLSPQFDFAYANAFENVNITNNIFDNKHIRSQVSVTESGGVESIQGAESASGIFVRNNIWTSSSSYAFYHIIGAVVENNIFYNINIIPESNYISFDSLEYSLVFNNNITYLTEQNLTNNSWFAVGSNNSYEDPQYVDFPVDGAAFSLDHDYNLQPTSPGLGAGVNGEDLGIYGGSSPWPGPLDLKPKGPIVTEIQPVGSPSVPAGSTLEVNFKSVINN